MTAYNWRDEIPEFQAAWDKALAVGVSALEDEAHRRAFEGLDKPLTHNGQFTYLRDFSAVDPETGQTFAPHEAPVLRDEHGNPRIATMKEYSDTLAIFLLKAHAPEKYRENAKIDLTNSDGKLQPVDDTARSARVAQLLAIAAKRKAGQELTDDDFGDLA